MKYESELIKEIVDSRGHEKSSLHYQSECVEAWIDESKGAYPKLCDYESEWLNYINKLGGGGGSEEPEPPIGEFPYVTLSDVTEATIENVVPYAYKSAILKGNTGYRDIDTGEILETFEEGRNLELVSVRMPGLMTYANLFTGFVAFGYIDNMGNVVELQGNILSDFIEIHEKTIAFRTFRENGKPSTRYGEFAFYDNNKNFIGRKISSDTKDEYTIVPDGTKYVRVWSVPLDGLGLNTKGMMIYTKDKPSLSITKYLESNITNILTVNEDVTLRSNGSAYDELDLLTGKLTQRIDENGEVLSQEVVKIVNLSITNQDGETLTTIKPIEGTMHLLTSGESIKPTFSGEVPVEAITQNLSSFIEEE